MNEWMNDVTVMYAQKTQIRIRGLEVRGYKKYIDGKALDSTLPLTFEKLLFVSFW